VAGGEGGAEEGPTDAGSDGAGAVVELVASRTGEHRGWTIRVTPQPRGEQWTALVEVWPPELSARTHGGTVVPFSELADDQGAIMERGMTAARRYLDRVAR